MISSYATVDDGFQMVDSTLRCKNGLDPRFMVIKSELKMSPNDTCEHCGKTLIYHFDVSCVKTDEELDAEAIVQYMNAP